MNTEDERYKEVVDLLRRSRPELTKREFLRGKIMQKIGKGNRRASLPEIILEYFFGWIYISWVRRCLIASSFAILVVFVVQQSLIIRRMSRFERQTMYVPNRSAAEISDNIYKKVILRSTAYTFPADPGKISEKQVDELIESFNTLQINYMDILKILKEDPVLKEYIEKKLDPKERKKLNL